MLALTLGLMALATSPSASAPASSSSADGRALRTDAPVPPPYRAWVLRAGSICPEIGSAQIAAQLDLESAWRPDAYADSGEVPARGIAQFTDATWAAWGADADQDGVASALDPPDAIVAQGRLMCDLVAWARRGIADGRLRGAPMDVAWAAYFCGRACITRAGGVPVKGLAHDYPGQIRARLPRYAAHGPSDGWTLPLRRFRLTSGFGSRWESMHAGQDFAAPVGTPILAAAAGTVVEARCTSRYCDRPGGLSVAGCGWTVTIAHGDGITTRYCHAVGLAVREGQPVAVGQPVGWVGSTGNSTGAHLHFEVRRNGKPIDPLPYLRARRLRP
ncbi:peptidoglycan DD-metalloendopeptidase family protein [Cryptosporangium aurantiacum]|uniref:peptidoglycan DD-metalloendopeptidase family protein n=1 Tax=Cryptosporangium aurantiacum TaxID=134849 RepID=UPI001C4A078B|nr:peptidoglycan DD-metalloendopeptidase family protein [Cryptosporangium aurantiacum]